MHHAAALLQVLYGLPEIFNSDQGSQFTSVEFTDVLKTHDVAISMDGKGRWIENVFVERLWRSVNYENVYLHAYESVAAARAGISEYLDFFNRQRPHSSLGGRTPDGAYFLQDTMKKAGQNRSGLPTGPWPVDNPSPQGIHL